MKKWLEEFTTSMARSPEESRLLGNPSSARTKMFIYTVLSLVLIGIFVPTSYLHFGKSEEFKVYAPLSKSDWIVAYDDVENFSDVCDPSKQAEKGCPAHPDHPFWKSTHRRSDKKRLERNNERRGKAIWYFAKYKAKDLKSALEARANLFVLGVTSGDIGIWINGKYLYEQNKGTYRYYTAVPVDMKTLSEDLQIAVRILHNTNFRFPDRFMITRNEGFATSNDFTVFQSKVETRYFVMPLLLLIVYFLISALFFFFWLSAKKKPEYAALSIFVMVLCLREVLAIPFVYKQMSDFHYNLRIVTSLMEAYSIIWLGLTYSRTKLNLQRDIFLYTSVILLSYGFAVTFLLKKDILFIYHTIYAAIVPLSYFFASLLCVGQFLSLALDFQVRFKRRLIRLGLFSGSMLIVSANQLMFMNRIGVYETEEVTLFRFLSGLLILALSYVILSEYREQELIIEKNPLTKYHKYPYIGRKVTGLLLAIDLKKSEKLYRKRAEAGGEQTLVSQWRVCMIQEVKDFGALYLQSKGDELFIFFDYDEIELAHQKALEFLRKLMAESESFRLRKLALREIDAHTFFNFRSSIVEGQLRPVFDTIDGKEYPEWEEAGETTPFVDGGRLLALEKTLSKSDQNYLVVTKELAGKFDCFPLMTIHEGELQDKAHGKAFKVASLNLDSLHDESYQKRISA